MDLVINLADTKPKVFSENMCHPEPIKIVIIKKHPKVIRRDELVTFDDMCFDIGIIGITL